MRIHYTRLKIKKQILMKIVHLLKKRYNEIIKHKTYTDKQISKGIFDLVKLKKITRNESNDVSKLCDKQTYSAETHEELKAVLKDSND